MPETVLDYDKQIWTIFSVGVVASVVILYHVVYGIIDDFTGKILALTLGFFILTYCFFATCGYGIKKRENIRALRRRLHPNIRIYQSVGDRLDNRCYPRSRWMGETILGLIGIYYIYVFGTIEMWAITIPIIITLFFSLLSCIANSEARRK